MSLNGILNLGTSGLLASQTALRNVAGNIANQQTDGYARREVQFESLPGRGVSTARVVRIADRYLDGAAARAGGDAGYQDRLASAFDRISGSFGRPGSGVTIADRLSAVQTSAIALSAGDDRLSREAFLTAIDNFLLAAQGADAGLAAVGSESARQADADILRINALLSSIARLNGDVSSAILRGIDPGSAADRRQQSVTELSALMDISTTLEPMGALSIATRAGVDLVGHTSQTINLSSGQLLIGDRPLSSPGGALGANLDLANGIVDGVRSELSGLVAGVADDINALHSQSTTLPPPPRYEGTVTGLIATDRLSMTGTLSLVRTDSSGAAIGRVDIASSSLPAGATIADLIASIERVSGGTISAAMVDGRLSIGITSAGEGLVLAGDARRGIQGLPQAFGLNDLVLQTKRPALLSAEDTLAVGAGETLGFQLRDANGVVVASADWTATGADSVADLIGHLNSGPLSAFGSAGLGADGRMTWDGGGLTLSAVSDSTDRAGTGVSLSNIFSLGAADGVGAVLRPDIASNADRLSLYSATTTGVGLADPTGFAAAISSAETALGNLVGGAGARAATASSALNDASARLTAADARRESVSGVSLDEEMTRMIAYQNSYAASARIITTARDMYDILLSM
ncbi:MAG: flagellar basal body rod C-terminal domain-containing protein [Pacificimonas sp.]